MSVFGKLFGAALDVVMTPVDAVVDLVMVPGDASDGKDFMHRTTKRLKRAGEKVKDAADEAAS